MRKRTILATLSAAAVALPFMMLPSSASAHGFISSPKSRSALCGEGKVKRCGQIQWEPQSVEGPKGYPAGGPADGRLCAGADGRWAPLDDPRNGTWPATALTSGASFSFTWEIEARHSTSTFRYYITKPSWNPTQPISRAQIESTPFLTVPYGGALPAAHTVHTGTLPAGRTGQALIFAVWDVADTDNAFYSCSDVKF
ncbi:lytic polysaccharide monooxygenase auxiliary activity family 9 protein [Embleya scabrispora]|uniref:lytic polysaccharide monooxygenase auxiliary activity family 9 protein n=1 Tax=Embleya scabrispora TaxID=159449 RepID=UPI000380440F|nr:lytic polysaccharide monooxygenase [Embleya scabrispora]MYS82775.1 chitin-binding protein [Streptomyces sp. SID5474]